MYNKVRGVYCEFTFCAREIRAKTFLYALSFGDSDVLARRGGVAEIDLRARSIAQKLRYAAPAAPSSLLSLTATEPR